MINLFHPLAAERSGRKGAQARRDDSFNALTGLSEQVARALGSKSELYLLKALIDQIPDFLFVKDTQCRFLITNAAINRAYGVSADGLIGKTDHDLHPAERAEEFFRHEQDVLTSGVPMLNMQESFPDGDGVRKHYSTTKVPLRDRTGTIVGLIGVARDVTERKQIEAFESQQNTILEMIAKNAPLLTVLDRLVLMMESQLVRVRGSILLFDAATGCLHGGAAPSLPEAYCRALDGLAIGPKVGSCGTAAFRREPVIVRDIQSDPLWENYKLLADRYALRSCWSTPILSYDGGVLGTFAIYSGDVRSPAESDIRLIEIARRIAGIAIERHQAEERLVHMAHYDGLTGLPNRVLVLDRLSAAMAERRGTDCRIALLYIDLDGFKQVNDSLGHHFGDLLLRDVGKRLRNIVSAEHTIARLGGDEFAAIQFVQPSKSREEAAKLALQVIDALSFPYDIEGHRVLVGATVGIAIAPEDAEDPDALLRDADLALYQAKADQRGGVQFFEPEMNVRAQERRALESDLRRALEAEEFELFYQPLIDLGSDEVCGFEALVRWHHPERGMVSPLEFIGVAEEIGLIVPMGEWALRQACRQAALWPRSIKIAVNLSPVQFRHDGLLQSVISALSCSGLSPHRLELEITESVILMDNEANLTLLHQLRNLGVQISLDDFGTGYSSLSYLRSFPFTKIKIDRSFVRDLEENPDCIAIIRAVSRLASDLGMRTTAEGVETTRQLAQLRSEGCNEGQGYLFGPPMPADEASSLLYPDASRVDAA